MNRFFFTSLLITIFNFCNIYADQYNELFMRDISIFLNNSESITVMLNTKLVLEQNIHMAVTDEVSEVLYYESSPILTNTSLIQNLAELAEITELLLEPDILKCNQNIQNFKNVSRYKDTILQDNDLALNLSRILKQLKLNYDTFEQESIKKFPSSNLPDLQKEIQEQSYKRLTAGTFYDQKLFPIAFIAQYLFKYFLVMKKIRSANLDIREASQALLLIIPQSYLTKAKTNMSSYLEKHQVSPTNEDEIALGLRYKTLPKFKNAFNSNSYLNQTLSAWGYEFWVKNSLILDLSKIFFIEKLNIKTKQTLLAKTFQKTYEKYLWNIYMSGHGSESIHVNSTIAGMPQPTFLELLKFLNFQLNTNILFVVSCFGAGERLRAFSAHNLNFVLAIASITKSITARFHLYSFTLNSDKGFELVYKTNVSNFFEGLRKASGQSYFNIFNSIQLFWKRNKKDNPKFYKKNIPQIKLPNTEWFQIIDLQKNEFNLNKLLLQLHEYTKKPIIIKNKSLLFLNTRSKYEQHLPETSVKPSKKQEANINVNVIIQGTKAPLFISMEPENAKYNLASIDARDFSLSHLALKLMGIPTQLYNRTFNIRSLTIRKPSLLPQPYYQGCKVDSIIFYKIFSAAGTSSPYIAINSLPDPIILNNVTVKVRTTGIKPIFRLKFEYNNMKHIIEQSSYADIRTLFKTNAVKTNELNLAVTDMVSEVLYSESCPAIVAKTTLQHLFELSNIVEQLIESNPTKYQQNLQNFNIPRYFNTILQDAVLIKELTTLLRRMHSNYYLLLLQILKELNIKPLEKVQAELENCPILISYSAQLQAASE